MAKNPPDGWSTLSTAIFYDDAAAAIDWLCKVLGFETRLRVDGENGQIVHSELVLGGSVIMVSSAKREPFRTPRAVGGANTQSAMIYVSDIDRHYARARAAGAKITYELETKDYGEDYGTNRQYELEDIGGHRWWITQRL
jgi:uncharacterized glyoxalase superfamily protein PhnB